MQKRPHLCSGHKWSIRRWSRILEVLAEGSDYLIWDGRCILQPYVDLYEICKCFGSLNSLLPPPVGLALTNQRRQRLCTPLRQVQSRTNTDDINYSTTTNVHADHAMHLTPDSLTKCESVSNSSNQSSSMTVTKYANKHSYAHLRFQYQYF